MITIERAHIEDAQKLVEAKINAFRDEVSLYGSGPPEYDSIDNQTKAIEFGYYYKIMEDEKLIGGMGVYDKGDHHFRIGSIFVDIDYQNRAIGTRAMEFIDKEFPKVKKWTLETPYLSFRNHHFYEKFGFVKMGQTEAEPERNGFYLFLYEKAK
jgi:N-acetylglutamate synthase-like GNAT family acetyltransferase